MLELFAGFAKGKKGKGLLRHFKVRIHAVDSTIMEQDAYCMRWAKHRGRRAASKMYLRLDLHGVLPSFAIVDSAANHDHKLQSEVCASIRPREIVVFDKVGATQNKKTKAVKVTTATAQIPQPLLCNILLNASFS